MSATLKLALEAGKIVPKDPNAGHKPVEYLPYWAAAPRPFNLVKGSLYFI